MKRSWLVWELCILIFSITPAVAGEKVDKRPSIGLTLRYAHDYDPTVLGPMRQELRRLFRRSPARPFVSSFESAGLRAAAEPAVMIRFHGNCSVTRVATEWAPGPLATTAILRGRVVPFVDIYCDRVLKVIWPVLLRQPNHRPFYFGRALARILAHELHHAVNGEREHTESGLTKARLNPRELTMGAPLALLQEFRQQPQSAGPIPQPLPRDLLAQGLHEFHLFGASEVSFAVSWGGSG